MQSIKRSFFDGLALQSLT